MSGHGLIVCGGCGEFILYRLLRESDTFVHKHRKHGGRWVIVQRWVPVRIEAKR